MVGIQVYRHFMENLRGKSIPTIASTHEGCAPKPLIVDAIGFWMASKQRNGFRDKVLGWWRWQSLQGYRPLEACEGDVAFKRFGIKGDIGLDQGALQILNQRF